jgi:aspartyl protease family protein
MTIPPQQSQPPQGHGWLWLLLVAVGLAGLVIVLNGRFPEALADSGDVGRLVYLLAWVVLAGGGLVLAIQRRPLQALRHAAIWLAIGLVLVIGYSYRDGFGDLGERLSGELMPQRGMANADGSVSFRAGQDGHFHVEALADGIRLRLLVDTGASDVVLSPADARRMGFDLDHLDFTDQAETANGHVRSAPVRLHELVIGPIRLTNVRAAVNEAEMSESLLGLSFLSRLDGYEVSGDRLTLRQ